MDIAKINNRSNFIFRDFPNYHPESMKYIEFWRKIKKFVVEGYWGQDTTNPKETGMWRFMPPQLYFYTNLCYILHKKEGAAKNAPRRKVHPNLDDIDWDFSYKWLEARGFSGFSDDEEYTCCRDVELFHKGKLLEEDIPKSAYNKQGILKKFTPARTYINKLFDKPLGIPLYDNEARNLVLLGARGAGKDLEENTIIHSVTRGRIPIKDVLLGEYIWGDNGEPTKVVDRKDFNNQMQYKITLADGRNLIAGEGHLWKVIDNHGKELIVDTANIRDNYKAYERKAANGKYDFDSKYFIPINKPIQGVQKDLLVNPYFLGLWLGDGNSHNTGITTIDSEIKNFVYDFSKQFPNHIVNINENTSKTCPTYTITSGQTSFDNFKGCNLLLNNLRELNVINNKHIPEDYFHASYEQRLDLLKGLMDSDGYISRNGETIEFSSSITTLSEDVIRLARTLGIRTEYSTRIPHYKNKDGEKVYGKLNYRIRLKPLINIFKLSRKRELFLEQRGAYSNSTRNKIAIKNVEEVGIKPSVCIGVDNESHLFVAGEYVVTHNSFWAGQLVILHEIITDGAKEYTEESIKSPAKVELFVGAAMASKSADLLDKTLMALNNLPGIWKPGTDEEIPSPLYKRATGSLLQPSKVPWICKYQKKFGGEWQWVGSHSSIKHGTWTTENPEAAAGGRYNVVVAEEFGLMPNSIQVHMSNIPTMYIEHKFGSALYLGTGGNIEKIQQSQTIFCEPESFESLEFDDIWENTGKIGYFIPATYSDRKFKDANGNTRVEEALAYYMAKREKAKKAKSGNALDMEMQNYPLVPSEMFLNKNRNAYPLADLKHRLAELLTNDKILNATYKGRFNIDEDGEIKWKNEDLQPIREYPLKNDDAEGCVEMFFMPQRSEDGRIPYGRYIAALDPIDDDGNEDNNLSLQSFFIYDLWTEKIVLEYSARTKFAKDFYEQCRRGLLYYNARLLYENNKKGPFTYFDNKNSLYLLEDTPPELRDMDMQKGSTVGNKGKGIYGTPAINKWGRSELGPAWMNEQAVGKPEGVTNCQTILSVGLIREAMLYNPDVNADRISAFGILMIFREVRIKYKPDKEAKAKASYNEDKFFARTYGYRQPNFYAN